MSHFPFIPVLEHPDLSGKFPEHGIRAPLEYHDAIQPDESEFEVDERELIAADASSLNEAPAAFLPIAITPGRGVCRRSNSGGSASSSTIPACPRA
ncbi:hypothetical protein SAMN05421539_102670 [Jannaschia seohaensis]|uniref:Uncharacterized protein n=1 Tax=Jannaschia seohaensis TaxID=475081 RepID=A0A2Y9C5W7_9RHOB|nr:hypothetical protein BCF38_102670 [Jannaschia seohaensis]SSA42023.1 hypothetical protein SAMN05421539_102670 [Jannaschia seohaensis]